MEAKIQPTQFCETIGIFSTASIEATLEVLLDPHPYNLKTCATINELTDWVQERHPRMVLLDSRDMETELKHELSPAYLNLKNALADLKVLSLVISRASSDMKPWREQAWPHLHFYYGELKGLPLMNLMLDLLKERTLINSPEVIYWGFDNLDSQRLRVLLREQGLRLNPLPPDRWASPQAIMGARLCDGFILNYQSWNKWDEGFKKEWRDLMAKYDPPWMFLSSEAPADGEDNLVNLYSTDSLHSLVEDMSKDVIKRSPTRKIIRLQATTGIYDQEDFLKILADEIEFAKLHHEEFSLAMFNISNETAFAEVFKAESAREIRDNLGLFIKTHVRSTDIVGKFIQEGIQLLLSRAPREIADAVATRLVMNFNERMQFYRQQKPEAVLALTYTLQSFPSDFQRLKEIRKTK